MNRKALNLQAAIRKRDGAVSDSQSAAIATIVSLEAEADECERRAYRNRFAAAALRQQLGFPLEQPSCQAE